MDFVQTKLNWIENYNGHKLNCEIDLAVHRADSDIVFLIVPGVDGSLDGYNEKYLKIAQKVNQLYSANCIRMSNPFITSNHWDTNLRFVLNWLIENSKQVFDREKIQLRIMGHSVGASVLSQVSWEYPEIKGLLLINPTAKTGMNLIVSGLRKFSGNATILMASLDPSIEEFTNLFEKEDSNLKQVLFQKIEGANHHFAGEFFQIFLESPLKYLF